MVTFILFISAPAFAAPPVLSCDADEAAIRVDFSRQVKDAKQAVHGPKYGPLMYFVHTFAERLASNQGRRARNALAAARHSRFPDYAAGIAADALQKDLTGPLDAEIKHNWGATKASFQPSASTTHVFDTDQVLVSFCTPIIEDGALDQACVATDIMHDRAPKETLERKVYELAGQPTVTEAEYVKRSLRADCNKRTGEPDKSDSEAKSKAYDQQEVTHPRLPTTITTVK